jgi:PAS domain S-box-containing protein
MSDPAASRPQRESRRLPLASLPPSLPVFGLTAFALLVTLAACAWIVWQSRERSLQEAARETNNLTLALAEQTSRVLESVDLIVRRAKQRVEENEGFTPADLAQMLSTGFAEVPQIRRLGVIDADGIAVSDSTELSPPRLDLSDREYVRALRERPDLGLFIGAPALSRADGQWSFYAARRVSGPNGEFRGAVVAVLEPRYFETFYAAIQPAADSAIALFRDDGVLLVRDPRAPGAIGRSFVGGTLFRELASSPQGGSFRSTSSVDGAARLTSFRRVPGYPVVISTSLKEWSVLAPWRKEAIQIGGLALAAVAVELVLHWLLLKHVRLHESLRSSERFFREMAEAMPQTVYFADENGAISYANNRWREVTGLPSEAGHGYGWLDFLHPDDRKPMLEAWGECLAGGTECRGEFRLRQADGTYRYFLFLTVPVRDEATGRIVRWFGSATDVDELRRTANDLQASEERLRFALSAARMYAFERDVQTDDVLRTCSDDIIGPVATGTTDFLERVHPDDRPKLDAVFERALAEDGSFEVEFRFFHADGRELWLTDKGRVTTDPASGTRRFAGVTLDITSAKRSQEKWLETTRQNGILAAAIHATTRGVVVVDALAPDHPVIFCNPGFTVMTGYAEDEVLGRSCRFLGGPDTDPATVDAIDAAIDRGEEFTTEIRNYRKDGTPLWNSLRISPVLDPEGALLHFVMVFDDVTARREMEAQLIEANDRLSHEVEERKRAGAQAEQASRAKTEFLAAMSHEIRTPLHAITGVTGLILERPDLHPDLRRQIEQIDVSGAALLTVVNDVLDFSKIEAGAVEIDPKPFWPHSLVKDCAAIVAAMASKKGLVVEVRTGHPLPNRLVGDEPRIRQVLLNLLNNAVKFTPSGRIEVSLEHEGVSPTEDRLRIAVTDTGIGIPESEHGRLFQRFSQIDGSSSRRYGGTGLGLAISRQLIELMGGGIGVESEPGRGSTFRFSLTLPKADVPRAAEAAAPVRAGERRRLRILLAEDVEINQEIARSILERAGHRVDVVSDGAEAVMAVQTGIYDLVLMDVQMPVMDGVTATQRIRALPEPVGTIPIVAMTANVFAEQIASFKAAGMNDHVGKPFKREELHGVVERWAPPAGSAAA